MNVSIFASAIRPNLFESCLNSLLDTSINLEVVFGGNCSPKDIDYFISKYPFFKYIYTGNIKPAQVYECCRRACTGELICWVADDCEFIGDIIGKAYTHWKKVNNRKLLLSLQTQENYFGRIMKDMNIHRFIGGNQQTPLMSPLGLMSREYLNNLGGLDKRYICGQYENDIAMRVYADNGMIHVFGDNNSYVDIDHETKHGGILPGDNRPFGAGYPLDRKVLESSWLSDKRVVLKKRSDEFQPYEDIDLLTKSQSNNIPDRWE